jgi:hypothetical protein
MALSYAFVQKNAIFFRKRLAKKKIRQKQASLTENSIHFSKK